MPAVDTLDKLFARWQQRYGLWLPVLQQLVLTNALVAAASAISAVMTQTTTV